MDTASFAASGHSPCQPSVWGAGRSNLSPGAAHRGGCHGSAMCRKDIIRARRGNKVRIPVLLLLHGAAKPFFPVSLALDRQKYGCYNDFITQMAMKRKVRRAKTVKRAPDGESGARKGTSEYGLGASHRTVFFIPSGCGGWLPLSGRGMAPYP